MIDLLLLSSTRGDIIKLAPLYFELKKHVRQFNPQVLYTVCDRDKAMTDLLFGQLGLPPPQYAHVVKASTPSAQTAEVLLAAEEILQAHAPQMILVFGDSHAALAVTLVADRLGIPVGHMDSGLRACDRQEPEEINRIICDLLSVLLFTYSDDANLNLIKEGRQIENIFLAGNLAVDTIRHYLPSIEKSDILGRLGVAGAKYIVATIHRPVNIDQLSDLERAVRIIAATAEKIKVIMPLHPRTSHHLEANQTCQRILNNLNITLCEPLGYFDFLKLMKGSLAVLTDSGGVQDECTYLGVPCLTMRETTERHVTVSDGTNRVVGYDIERINALLDFYLEGGIPSRKRPFLWDGLAAERIVRRLKEYFNPQSEGRAEDKSRMLRRAHLSGVRGS